MHGHASRSQCIWRAVHIAALKYESTATHKNLKRGKLMLTEEMVLLQLLVLKLLQLLVLLQVLV